MESMEIGESVLSNDNEASCSSDQSTVFSSNLNLKGNDSEGSDNENESYYFESDHLALKGNHDYQMMLRLITLLESQRIQAVKDLEKLHKCQEEALADPIQFVDKLQRGVDMGLPKPQKVPAVPVIDWEKYTSNLDFSTIGLHRHMTRLKRQLVDGSGDHSGPSSVNGEEETQAPEVIRGRIKTEDKAGTYNQLWTVEEQKRLEELLLKFPPEEVEAKRWQKIAAALGNRTPIQVQSRVQKYFIKLAKAGLPIPGRRPNVNAYGIRKGFQKQNQYRKFYYQSSTFLHAFDPPVYMSDDEDSQDYYGSIDSQSQADSTDGIMDDTVSDDESVPIELRSTEEYQQLLLLKKFRKEKLNKRTKIVEHIGYKCDRCECEPIVGTRWHCVDCPKDLAIDFCDDCVDSTFETEHHNSSHRLKPKRKAEAASYVDTDYTGFMPGGYNYLDPNYMPAS